MVGGEDTVWADVTAWSLVLFLKLVQVGLLLLVTDSMGSGWLWQDVAAWLLGLWHVGERLGTWPLGLGPRKQGCLAGSSDSCLLPVGACGTSGKGNECQRDLWRLQLTAFTFL